MSRAKVRRASLVPLASLYDVVHTGAWPRLTTTDSALIRFLLSNGVSRADIHNNLGWSSSTIIAHGSQKNKGALDQKLVNAKFYEILDKARYSRPNMPGTNRWVQINARENGGTDSGSVARKIKVHGRMGRQSNKAFPYQGSRSSRRTEERLVSSSPSSTTSSRASALAPHSSTHDDKFLRAFVTRAKLDKECIGMLKAAGLTTAAKLSAAAEMPHPVMEQFVATCL
ncbi:hypothetical protein C8R47DRAFT_1136406, partial [Mycena vitilis]